MKYIYVPVFARNIQYTASTKQFLSKLLDLAKSQPIKWWVSKKLDRYLRNEYQSSGLHKRYDPASDEDWVSKALERGDEIHDIDVSPKDRKKFEKLVNFLNGYPEPQKIRNLGVPDVEKRLAEAEAHRQLAEKKSQGTASKEIHVYSNGYKWVELLNPQDILSCGKEMQNCLKDPEYQWGTKVASKQVRVFALYDPKGKPHTAISLLKGGTIDQIRGKQNRAIISRYIKYFKDFVNSKYVKFKDIDTSELLANGFYMHNGKQLTPAAGDSPVTIEDDIILTNMDIVGRDDIWPTNLTIEGDLEIRHCKIDSWPEKLTVTGDITLQDVTTDKLPDDLVSSYLCLNSVHRLQHLPKNLQTDSLYIFDAPDLDLPNNLTVDSLYVTNKKTTKLPKKLAVKENLSLIDSNVFSLPSDLIVEETLYLKGSKVLPLIESRKVTIPKGVANIDIYSDEVIL